MKLEELIEGLETIDVKGSLNIDIQGVAHDSRETKAGDIFVCIQGFHTDGHTYAQKAIDQGALALIVEKDIETSKDITVIRVPNSRKALAKIAANFYGNPTRSMNVIGVTGTNGKTTITHLVKNIFESIEVPCGLIGTIACKILDKTYPVKNTTPESLELQKFFRMMLDQGVHACVMEVSSHALEMNRVDEIQYHIGVFTNLTRDHLDFHENLENYRNAKKKLFYKTTLANIINIDDEHGKKIADEIKELPVPLFTYGINEQADIYAKNIRVFSKGTEFTLVTPKFEGEIFFQIPGLFSVYNCLAAAAVAFALGYSFETIKKGLESVAGVPGRFELIPGTGDHTIIVDYAHTPDALENVLKAIREFAQGRIITVFGCGGDRDKTKRPIMGRIAGELSDYCIITSDNPRTEDPITIMNEIELGIKETVCKYKMIEDRKDAIREAIDMSAPEDVVLIAGKGHETYQILGNKVIDFDDRKVAEEMFRRKCQHEINS
ncbi:MAG TPA: UDP-N-acetylmuramoyl-L-alanyl-D-glutamate--2,6-diaminopimelate ligase [Clostridiales bacterium]|nr:UDP-N-acetylmuramoyl-L-alanyl-D-glutamate--2,6-diaminopimelate ligase [Clostridiales bacterium]